MLDERRDGDLASEGLTTLLHTLRRECMKGRSFDDVMSAGEQSRCHWTPVSTAYLVWEVLLAMCFSHWLMNKETALAS